jgi:hypothetical protein
MKNEPQVQVEIRDVTTGLWVWRLNNPFWEQGLDWEPLTASTCVESGGETLVLDPQIPPPEAVEVWQRFAARPPTIVVILKPDHVRDADLFVRRYHARAFGPRLFFRDDVPESELEPVVPGSQLPGGIVALYDGRGESEPRSGCPSNGLWFSPTRSRRPEASCVSGRRHGIQSEPCRHCARCLSFRLNT